MRTYLFAWLWLIPVIVSAQFKDSLSCSVNDFTFEKQEGFDKIIYGDDYLHEAGKPQLPVVTRSFVIPNNRSVTDLQIRITRETKFDGSYFIYPAQPPRTVSQEEKFEFTGPDSTYQSLSVYPAEAAALVSDGLVQGYHVITICYYPLGYVPGKRELYLRDISVEWNYTADPAVYSDPPVSYNRALLAKAFVKSMVSNPEEVELYGNHLNVIPQRYNLNGEQADPRLREVNVLKETVPDYVLITCDSLKSTFQRLADWKTKKGVPAVIKTVEEIERDYTGSDLPEKIRNYLVDVKKRWNGIGLFVLLGGDTNIVPTRMAYGYYEHSIYGADLYYIANIATWNPENMYLNVSAKDETTPFFGRIPVKNSSEATNFISKLLAYEKANNTSVDYSYFNQSLIVSSFLSGNETSYGAYMNEYFSYCQNRPNNYWYMFDHFNCTKNDHAFVQKYVTNQGEELSRNNFLSALQNGRNGKQFHFVFLTDHCGPTAMGASSKDKWHYIKNEDVDELTDNYYPKVILTTGCHPARFDKDCIAEHFLNKKNGGAVAFMGNTDVGWYSEYPQLDSLLNAAFATNPVSPLQYSLGYLRNKIYKVTSSYWRMHLLGDPETPLWTAKPSNFNVTITPTVVSSGANTISVKINNLPTGEKAMVCLMKGDEAYTTVTIGDRNVHNFRFTPRTSGSLDITVTAHNFKPYEVTIPVQANEGSAVRISELAFSDAKTVNSLNNGDDQPDAGETIDVAVQLKNGGLTTVTGLSGKLSCKSGYIELINDSVKFGNISPNGTVSGLTRFRFRIMENTPEIRRNDFNAIKFQLDVKGDDGTVYPDTFKIDIFATELALRQQYIGANLAVGSQIPIYIDLQNLGKAASSGVNAILYTSDPNIKSVSTAKTSYPVIGKNEVKSNLTPFVITLSDSYASGNSIVLNMKVSNAYGKNWYYHFDITEKCNKILPSQLNAISETDAIKVYWNNPGSNNIKSAVGYYVYRSDNGISGTYRKQNQVPMASLFFRDVNITSGNTYYYKVAGIAESGNRGDLSDPVAAKSSYPLLEGFPRSMNAPTTSVSSVNVCDLDGNGKKELFAGSSIQYAGEGGFLLGLNYQGNELINPQNGYLHGLAKLPASVTGTPAIGDLSGNGKQKIVVSTWNGSAPEKKIVGCYAVKDENEDGRADRIWNKILDESIYRGAVISNLDNSSDGTMETVVRSLNDTPLRVMDCNGNIKYSFGKGTTYSMVAVGDLDGDGKKEIVTAYDAKDPTGGGIYIWRYDGQPYSANMPFLPGIDCSSSPVICDINDDGKKEIIVSQKTRLKSYVYAIDLNGNKIANWDKDAQYTNYSVGKGSGLDHMVSVGDIDGDGKPEVVVLGTECIKAWKGDGRPVLNKTMKYIIPNDDWAVNKDVPILADVDGDMIADIIFVEADKIYAIRGDGSDIKGFPLYTNGGISGSVCVADIDGDGKNEIICIDCDSHVYAWKTEGSPYAIEWGSERHDQWNTGEYGPVCEPIYINFNTGWNGITPCGNVILNSGKFTVPPGKNLILEKTSKIIVRPGAILEVDGGTVSNAYILALPGGSITLKNNGMIKLRNNSYLDIQKGATLTIESGEIE